MLDKLFLQILNMSFTASFVILILLVVRMFLKKTLKIFTYILWSVVLIRLICPYSFESVLSLLPAKANPISYNIAYEAEPKIDTGITAINHAVNSVLPAAEPYGSINPLQIWIFLGRCIWLMGICILLIYSIESFIKLKKRLKTAILEKDNIYIAQNLETPFVLGVFHPKIYLPASLEPMEKQYILLHEQTHIKRLDHVIKILSFFVACLHWFNPIVWIAFFISGKDMEMACDEAVIRQFGNAVKKEYSSSLLTLSTKRRIVGGTPIAFGEGETKGRIKNVLNYKKPAFWVMLIGILAVAGIGIGLLANPKEVRLNQTKPEGIWENQTKYLGDNTAVGNIISDLSFPENLKYGGFELETSEQPYTITVNFKTDTKSRNANTGILNETPFEQNAILMFSLIENVDQIRFILDDGENPYSMEYSRSWAQDLMMKKQLFIKIDTSEKYQEYVNEISIKINRKIDIDIKNQSQDLHQENVKFFVKPDEPADVIADTAANVWLKSFTYDDVSAQSRISGFDITKLSVITGKAKAGEIWEDMDYQYVVNVNYNITAAADEYYSPIDGASGKNTFEGLYRQLCVKVLEHEGFEIVDVVYGGAGMIFAAPDYNQSLTSEEQKQTEELARSYYTNKDFDYGGVESIRLESEDSYLYKEYGLEGEYLAGNLIIYKVLTGNDKKVGNPERTITIARESKNAKWEVINEGF